MDNIFASRPAGAHPSRVEHARRLAADTFPEHLTDTKGRQHRSIPRQAILSGKLGRRIAGEKLPHRTGRA